MSDVHTEEPTGPPPADEHPSNGWSFHRPTHEYWYWREGEVTAKVTAEMWIDLHRRYGWIS